MKMTKEEFLEQIMTRREAEQYLCLSSVALQHHLRQGNLIPAKEIGSGKGKVQLFWKEDLNEFMRRMNKMTKFEQVGTKYGMEIEWEGKVLRLTQDVYIDCAHYGDWRDEEHRYTAIAVDSEDIEYRVYWEVIDQKGFAELEDTSDACDWDNPNEVIEI